MATESSIARRTADTITRIESRCEAISGGRKLELPRRNRHGTSMLLLKQLENLADFLDTLDVPEPSAYAGMTNAELKQLIGERGIVLEGKTNKPAMIAALEAADKAAAKETVNA